MDEPVLAYESPASQSLWTNVAVVVLWLWVILDGIGGTIIAIYGAIIARVIRDDPESGIAVTISLVAAIMGLLIVFWGIHTGHVAKRLHRRERGSALSALGALHKAQWAWLSSYPIVGGVIITLIRASVENANQILLPWLIFQVTVHIAIGVTIWITHKATMEAGAGEFVAGPPD